MRRPTLSRVGPPNRLQRLPRPDRVQVRRQVTPFGSHPNGCPPRPVNGHAPGTCTGVGAAVAGHIAGTAFPGPERQVPSGLPIGHARDARRRADPPRPGAGTLRARRPGAVPAGQRLAAITGAASAAKTPPDWAPGMPEPVPGHNPARDRRTHRPAAHGQQFPIRSRGRGCNPYGGPAKDLRRAGGRWR
jgi:hypothetical protein